MTCSTFTCADSILFLSISSAISRRCTSNHRTIGLVFIVNTPSKIVTNLLRSSPRAIAHADMNPPQNCRLTFERLEIFCDSIRSLVAACFNRTLLQSTRARFIHWRCYRMRERVSPFGCIERMTLPHTSYGLWRAEKNFFLCCFLTTLFPRLSHMEVKILILLLARR